MYVSAASIICMAICAVFCMVIPFVLLAIVKKKFNTGIAPFFIGWAVFTLFALILEPIMHNAVLLGKYGDVIQNNIWLYALYGGFAAGIFEETGRFVAFKTVMRKSRDKADGVMYGAGHGGFEALVVAGMGMISNIVMALMINLGLTDILTQGIMDETTLAALNAQLEQLATLAPATFLLGAVERCSAIALHIALSVLVWTAAKQAKKGWLYPVAILIHAFADGVLVILANGLGMNVYLVEAILAVMSAIIVFFAVKVYKSTNVETEINTQQQ